LDMGGWKQTGLKKTQLQALMQATSEEYEKGKAFISIIMQE